MSASTQMVQADIEDSEDEKYLEDQETSAAFIAAMDKQESDLEEQLSILIDEVVYKRLRLMHRLGIKESLLFYKHVKEFLNKKWELALAEVIPGDSHGKV